MSLKWEGYTNPGFKDEDDINNEKEFTGMNIFNGGRHDEECTQELIAGEMIKNCC